MVARMERHAEGPALLLSEEPPTPEYVGVIWLGDEPLVETTWLARDGCRMEVVFRRERDEWKIDWDAFVRYSALPWVMFAAGEGEPVQEFRLLARERLAGSNQYDTALSLVFHVPRFGSPGEPGASSPEFVMARASPQGQKLQALFRMKKEGKVPLGAHAPQRDPEGMIRVRVRIRREDAGGERRLVLEDVLAGHWLSVTESGIPDESDPVPDKRKGG